METRTCTKCKETKPLIEFYYQRGKPRSRCKICTNADNVARQASQPEKATARVTAWREANPEKFAATNKARRKAKPELFKRNEMHTVYRINFDELWEAQLGLCASCKRPMLRNGREPYSACVDHNHQCCPGKRSCGKCVRGLVHRNCNLVFGYAKDNPKIIEGAVRYLERWEAKKDNAKS